MNIPKHRLKLPPEAEHLHAKPPRKLSKRRIRKQREQEGQCRPRLAAFTGLLMGHFRQSTRLASSFLSDLLHIPSSPAWTVKIQSLIDSHDTQVSRLGDDLMRQERLLFEYGQRYKRAEVNWKAFRRLASPGRKEFNGLLLRGSYHDSGTVPAKTQGLSPS